VGLPAVDAVAQVRIEPLRPRLAAEGRQDHVGQIDRGEDVERTCGTHLGRVGVAVAGKVLEGEKSKRVNGQKRRKAEPNITRSAMGRMGQDRRTYGLQELAAHRARHAARRVGAY